MNRAQVLVLLSCGLIAFLAAFGAANNADENAGTRDKRSMPNWSMTASDFFGWVEQLRSLAGYDKISELARTYWAHFPSASRLGYEVPDPED
ncbi:otospiralin-like [Latimeria chalumnae]|uniref:otospiralin-like n=1 Tax=Latimeria chalumnae TaxID=7897 RepID=UPI0003C1250D